MIPPPQPPGIAHVQLHQAVPPPVAQPNPEAVAVAAHGPGHVLNRDDQHPEGGVPWVEVVPPPHLFRHRIVDAYRGAHLRPFFHQPVPPPGPPYEPRNIFAAGFPPVPQAAVFAPQLPQILPPAPAGPLPFGQIPDDSPPMDLVAQAEYLAARVRAVHPHGPPFPDVTAGGVRNGTPDNPYVVL